MGSISIRRHIRWGQDPPSESTSTLVLTSPGRLFVDTRLLTAAPLETGDRLDWAFAGSSSHAKVSRDDGSEVTHSVFAHWVDSRTTESQLVRDEGDMFPRPGGLALEVGKMVNPATGSMTAYEELWLDRVPASRDLQQPKCIVFQLLDEPGAKRGQLICLGQYAQGVLRVGDTFTGERWAWIEDLSIWEQTVKAGDCHEPLGFLIDGSRASDKVGD